MQLHSFRCARKSLCIALPALMLAACSPSDEQAAAQQAGAQAPMVAVMTVEPGSIALEKKLSGRLEAFRKAEVRARVPGVLQKRLFEEGSEVKAGQRLFLIDDAPYRATRDKAAAVLSKASADMERMRPLMEAGAISKQSWDQIVQAYRLAKADVTTADINLGYAHVTAPISGRIGKSLETEGALVGQGVPTLLAVIQQDNPLRVNITQSAEEVMKMRQAAADGQIARVEGEVPVTVSFSDGTVYPVQGRLLFTDPTVDEATGQVTLRAEIPNDDGVLFPGLFVNVHVAQSQVENGVLVPQQAVTRTGQGDVVMVANADGSFAPRPVRIAGSSGTNWIVGGLNAGDQVIVEGMMMVQMSGAKKVQTRPWQPENAAAPAAADVQAAAETSAETETVQ